MTFIEHNGEPGKPRAIETVFDGYRFRSRLEARWAVFFETLGLEWTYEPEGFEFDGIRYLPDFRVKTPQGEDIWYEVKPHGTKSEPKFARFKAVMATEAADRTGFSGSDRVELLAGDPFEILTGPAAICPRCGVINLDGRSYCQVGTIHHISGRIRDQFMMQCYPCDAETPFGGDSDEEFGVAGVKVIPHKGWVTVKANAWRAVVRYSLRPAMLRARQARFEHGEQP